MWALALEDTLIIERHGASLFDHTGADSSARLCYAYGGWSRSGGGGAGGGGGSLLSPSNQTPPANPRGSLQSPHAPPLLHHLHTDTRGIFLDFIIRPELRLMEPPADRHHSAVVLCVCVCVLPITIWRCHGGLSWCLFGLHSLMRVSLVLLSVRTTQLAGFSV